MSTFQQFLYVLVKEVFQGKNKKRRDTELRIVFWPDDRTTGTREHFVVYGNRPDTKKHGEYYPYRLVCDTIYEVTGLVNTLFSSYHSAEIELHQFSGLNDDSEDEYNIDWFNTNEDESTELVAFDINPTYDSLNEPHLYLDKTLNKCLLLLTQFDTI
jgi:hypothetical protein